MIPKKYCNMSPETGVWTRSSAADSIVRTVSFVPDPLKTRWEKVWYNIADV